MYAIPIRSIPPNNNNSVEINSFALQLNCHQCRHKKDFPATCKNPRDGKPCVLKYCHNCLENRYGEKIEEVYNLNDWVCPRCRGICICSVCRKSNDQEPTDQSGQTEKRKSQGGNKGFKTYPKKTKKARHEELQEVCNDSNIKRKRNPNDKFTTRKLKICDT